MSIIFCFIASLVPRCPCTVFVTLIPHVETISNTFIDFSVKISQHVSQKKWRWMPGNTLNGYCNWKYTSIRRMLYKNIKRKLSGEKNTIYKQMCLLCRDTAGQERFRTITTAYYRGAMVSCIVRLSENTTTEIISGNGVGEMMYALRHQHLPEPHPILLWMCVPEKSGAFITPLWHFYLGISKLTWSFSPSVKVLLLKFQNKFVHF